MDLTSLLAFPFLSSAAPASWHSAAAVWAEAIVAQENSEQIKGTGSNRDGIWKPGIWKPRRSDFFQLVFGQAFATNLGTSNNVET